MNPKRRHLSLLAAAWAAPLLAPRPVRAAGALPGLTALPGLPEGIGHGDGSPQWTLLRQRLFGEREILVGEASRVRLIVPLRAAFGASVPVRIVSRQAPGTSPRVRRAWLLVDRNPSPLAATIDFGEDIGPADLETRLRVDEYGHIRVVHELDDGSLHADSRYVKVSGGCSAPPDRERPELIGHTTLRLPEGLHPGRPTPLELTVLHPNDTGFAMNQRTLLYMPAHFVRRIRLQLGGRLLFEAETDFSISENPHWRLFFLPRERGEDGEGGGRLRAEVEDSREQRFAAELDPWAGPAT